MNNKFNVTIEIPKNSQVKYEIDRKTNQISVDRVLYGAMHYPLNYGFFPQTLDWDGDELDCLVFADHSFIPGVSVPIRIIGAMKMIDGGETDTKILGVIDVDPRWKTLTKLSEIPSSHLNEIRDFFENYKNLQNKKVEILGFEDVEWALKEYAECKGLFDNYNKLEKDDFIAKMKAEHPQKYKA